MAVQLGQQVQAALQQQQQTNSMLAQLPQDQRSQIEQAVKTYREQLLQKEFGQDVVQQYVWQYYMQCVQTLYQNHTGQNGGGSESSTAAAATAAPSEPSPPEPPPPPPPQESGPAIPKQPFTLQLNTQLAQQLMAQRQQLQTMNLAQNQGLGKGGTVAQRVAMLQRMQQLQQQNGGGDGMGMGMGKGNQVAGIGGNLVQSQKGGPWQPGLKGVRFPLGARPRPAGPLGIRGFAAETPAARLQLQQAQHKQRMLQQGDGSSSATGPWGGCGGKNAGKNAKGMGKSTGMAGGGGFMGGAAGAKSGPPFPPALQQWLQRLFAHQSQAGAGDPNLQKQTHTYLRHWVQMWVKTGELWQRNWETAPLPTAEEIRANRPPGSGGMTQGFSHANDRGFSSRQGYGEDSKRAGSPKRDRERSRSRSRRQSRSRGRRRRRRSRSRSRSQRRSRSRTRSRSRSRKRAGSTESSGSTQNDGKTGWPAAKGKGKAKGRDADMRGKVQKFLEEKLGKNDWRGKQKELQNELQRALGVNTKMFRQLFSQTVVQFMQSHYQKSPPPAQPAGLSFLATLKKVPTNSEQEMRDKRAARFQNHLGAERSQVAMVTFNDSDIGGNIDGGPIVGSLNGMCSREEAREREQTRQLDKFEWAKGSDARNPTVNVALATKKYQRSSADKAYRSQDVRTLDSCWRTMEYLMTEILDFDRNPKPVYCVQNVSYIDVYSFLRDRTRACRVDLTLQQPTSTCQRAFVETHEVCLRFEMLSLFLMTSESLKADKGTTEKYDPKLGLKAISQTMEPLLNAYGAVRDKLMAKSILAEVMGGLGDMGDDDNEEFSSPSEFAVHRYIILLLMSAAPEELLKHLAKLSKAILAHPLVTFATQAFAAFKTEDYSTFLRFYKEADFLSAVAMSGIADLARLRCLWMFFRTYPQPVGDKIPLERIKNILAFASDDHARSFLRFHGVKVLDGADGNKEKAVIQLPKKGTPEAEQHKLLIVNKLPDKCDYHKGADSLLMTKFTDLGLTRKDIVFGAADPVAVVEEAMMEATEVPFTEFNDATELQNPTEASTDQQSAGKATDGEETAPATQPQDGTGMAEKAKVESENGCAAKPDSQILVSEAKCDAKDAEAQKDCESEKPSEAVTAESTDANTRKHGEE